MRGTNEQGWIVRVKLDTASQSPVSANVVSIEPLTGKAPENVIETDLAKKRATPITTTGTHGNPRTSEPVSILAPADTTAVPGLSTPTTIPNGQAQSTSSSPVVTSPGSTPDEIQNTTTPTAVAPGTTTPATAETPAPTDTTAPAVISTTPIENAIDVDIVKMIRATFSEGMDAASINESTFTLFSGSIPVSARASYDAKTRTAALNPDRNLEFGATYTATITDETADLAGNKLDGNYSWTFTTVSAPDTTPPTVTSVNPGNNTGDTAVNVVIEAVFDEAMNSASVLDTTNFSLKTGGTIVNCAADYDTNTKTATFTPDASLHYSTTYTATLTTGVMDAAGNHLVNAYTWNFSTGSPSQVVTLSIDTPETAPSGSILDVKVNISEVTNLSAFEFDLVYDETVIQISEDDEAVTQGMIGSTELEYNSLIWLFVQDDAGKLRILGEISGPGVSGSGYIAELHFKVIGAVGQTSNLTLSNMIRGTRTYDFLFDNNGENDSHRGYQRFSNNISLEKGRVYRLTNYSGSQAPGVWLTNTKILSWWYSQLFTGKVIVKQAPSPGLLETSILPPWARTISLAIASPRPNPVLNPLDC